MKKAAFVLASVFIFLLSGCTLDHKLAKNFVKNEFHDSFYILQPAFIFKYNLKDFEVPGVDTLDQVARDSILLERSLFLKEINDSLLVHEYIQGLTDGLGKYKAKIILEKEVDTLMTNGGKSYIINIAQFSMEEYVHPYSEEEYIYDQLMLIDGIDLNALNYNIWLELGRLNTEEKNKVLFMSDFLLDDVSGMLKTNLVTGKMSYDYTIDTISMDRVYAFAKKTGEVTASLLFDYLMNTYVKENVPKDYPYEILYYHYDPVKHYIYPVDEQDRIIELDNQ
jgi:hypothetical protein